VADAAVLLVALAMIVGTLGEPSARRVFEPGHLDAAQIAFRLAMLLTTGALAGWTAQDLIRRIRRRRSVGA
jgi:hypothetical protein